MDREVILVAMICIAIICVVVTCVELIAGMFLSLVGVIFIFTLALAYSS